MVENPFSSAFSRSASYSTHPDVWMGVRVVFGTGGVKRFLFNATRFRCDNILYPMSASDSIGRTVDRL